MQGVASDPEAEAERRRKLRGRKVSEETRAKLREAHRRRREGLPAVETMQPVKLSDDRARELVAGEVRTDNKISPQDRAINVEPGSVFSRMSNAERAAFRKWRDRQDSEGRYYENSIRWSNLGL